MCTSVPIDEACLFGIASEQAGYFTTSQAQCCGFSWRLLSHHTSSGRFIRIERGLYRYRDYPSSPYEEVMAAWLAVGKNIGVVSHESALDLLDLTDVIPNSIHITVPRVHRRVETLPGTTLHSTSTPPQGDEIITRHGILLTDPIRTLLDAAEDGTAPEQIVQGVATAIKRGLLTRAQLEQKSESRNRRTRRLIELALEVATS